MTCCQFILVGLQRAGQREAYFRLKVLFEQLKVWVVLQGILGKGMEIHCMKISMNVFCICYSDGQNGENPAYNLKGKIL